MLYKKYLYHSRVIFISLSLSLCFYWIFWIKLNKNVPTSIRIKSHPGRGDGCGSIKRLIMFGHKMSTCQLFGCCNKNILKIIMCVYTLFIPLWCNNYLLFYWVILIILNKTFDYICLC